MYKIINRHVYEIASGENITLCDIVADASTDLPGADDQALYKIAFGSFAFSIADKCFYCLDSSGTWTAADINASDFYTKAEIDAFLLTINTTLNKDRAALVEIVDGGAKNVLQVDEIGVSATHGQTYTTNGVTFTLNSDGSITATRNETSTSNSDCNLRFNGANFYVDDFCNGKYVLSGCPAGGSYETYFIRANRNDYAMLDYGEGVLLEQTTEHNIYITLRVTSEFTGTIIFKPMICSKAAWDISPVYQPYRPSYQELYDRILVLENNP